MIPLAEAQARVLERCHPGMSRTVSLADALGRVLAETVTAPDDVPPFANSAMDGFAVHVADTAGASAERPAVLRIVGTVAAGAAPDVAVGPGEALRIMTGAPIPEGADGIAVVETTRSEGDQVRVDTPVVAKAHIRAAGGDLLAGAEVFGPGTVLGAGHLGVLSSVARSSVSVVAPPLVGVLSTGDELVTGGGPLRAGQIRESNRAALLGLLRRDGFVGVDLGTARDEPTTIRQALGDGARHCDAILTSGGVSMGDFDWVKRVLGEMSWMQVAIRPAKPFAFGRIGEVPVFGLPGNPVSAMVSYELLARPGLRRMAGHDVDDLRRRPIAAVVDDDSCRRRPDGRTAYVRVAARLDDAGYYHVRSAGPQGSHHLRAMADAGALAVVPDGSGCGPGQAVGLLLLT